MQQQLDFGTKSRSHFAWACGFGVDSVAGIIGCVKKDIRPDFILFADVGAEKKATYEYIPILQQYLKEHNFPQVITVKLNPPKSPYDTIEGNMTMNATLPGAAFKSHTCTVKWKIKPQNDWVKKNLDKYPNKIIKAIGYEAGEEHRKINAAAHTQADEKYEYWYPLIEWGWDREECKARIREAGLPIPVKSSCIFCPNIKPKEFNHMTKDELGRIVRVEVIAEPYNKKVQGLWRKPRKRDNRPGSITEYLLQNGIEFTHPDEFDKIPLNPNCQKFKKGYTFHPPHIDKSLADLIGGCNCITLEHKQHEKIIQTLPFKEVVENL